MEDLEARPNAEHAVLGARACRAPSDIETGVADPCMLRAADAQVQRQVDPFSYKSGRRRANTDHGQLEAGTCVQGRAPKLPIAGNEVDWLLPCILGDAIEIAAAGTGGQQRGPQLNLRAASKSVGSWWRPFIIKIRPLLVRDASRSIMDKFLLQQQVLERLAEDLLQVEQAAWAAHETATHEESVAENKYDTLGLEAAYLATGQARRADALRQAMANWRQFRPHPYDASKGIQLGALVCLVDSADNQHHLFLGPDGGSMKLVSGARHVQVISGEAPLGRAILGKSEGDEVSILVAQIRQQFEVLRVH